MYESPITVIQDEMQMQIENDIYKAVQRIGINVNKEELTKALAYDRNQYEKGYADGYENAIDEFVERARNVGRPIGCDHRENKPLYAHTDGTWHDLIADIAEDMKGGAT